MFNDFNPFVFTLEDNCTVAIRITDDVLEPEDWGIDELVIADGIVISQKKLSNGIYTMSDMVGWTTDKLMEWSQYDSTGRHPGQFNEISL